jgi:mono/diheme cytochrome c family protein
MLRGFSVSQLNRPSDDGVDQIAMLESLGVIVWPWKGGEIPVMPPVADESFSLAQRARAYLHVNCAHCHQPGGRSDSSRMDLRRETPLVLTGTCGEHPSAEHPGHADALLIAPGDPARSLVSIRVHDDGAGAMPPGRARVDSEAAELIDAWIRSLDACSEPHTAAGDQPRAGT